MMGAIRAIAEWEKRDVNVRSYSTAQLGAVVTNAFSSKSSVKASDFLPFEMQEYSNSNQSTAHSHNKPTSETKEILKGLIRLSLVPKRALVAFVPDIY